MGFLFILKTQSAPTRFRHTASRRPCSSAFDADLRCCLLGLGACLLHCGGSGKHHTHATMAAHFGLAEYTHVGTGIARASSMPEKRMSRESPSASSARDADGP